MKLLILFTLIAAFGLQSNNQALAQRKSDTCHVYVVDAKTAAQFFEKADLDALGRKPQQEQEAIAAKAGVTEYEHFHTKVGEEELTTQTYPFPKSKKIITVSIFYTDESMASTGHSDSMQLGVVVADNAYQDAIGAPDSAVAEVSYDGNTDVLRVKKNISVNGRDYLVGLECRCKENRSGEKEKK
jgi:hypothetical protein